MTTKKPIPDWFFSCLDILDEVQDSMTCSRVRVRESCLVSGKYNTDLTQTHSSNNLRAIRERSKLAIQLGCHWRQCDEGESCLWVCSASPSVPFIHFFLVIDKVAQKPF